MGNWGEMPKTPGTGDWSSVEQFFGGRLELVRCAGCWME